MNSTIAKKAGLVSAGVDEEGQPEYVGTTEQWDRYEMIKNEVNDMLYNKDEGKDWDAYESWVEERGDLEDMEKDKFLEK